MITVIDFRIRNYIIYFAPNIGTKFQLIKKLLPRGKKLHEVVSRFTLKVSYSYMKKKKTWRKSKNPVFLRSWKKFLNATLAKPHVQVIAEENQACFLRGNCFVSDIIYKATVKSVRGIATYVELCSGEDKKVLLCVKLHNDHNQFCMLLLWLSCFSTPSPIG